ncbi:FecR domain-containing protein [Candidatus Sulfidibacterium hydrothermale]|uniref:FecR family protein n=1 Tax=Candidatus Sulfidibacterium hydrothermale TaxID=2875962 RepID=UPI001F0AC7FB|nr:FecR domain-containing protein [Candidatus Sulfidibacterium hydrothermale]UBM62670.1 FecR domain-containing protein [Candidatus Sulfidibacterium hydrothermale]
MISESKIKLLQKFFKDQCTEYELLDLTRWINQPETLDEILPEFKKLLAEYNPDMEGAFDSEKVLEQIQKKIANNKEQNNKKVFKQAKQRILFRNLLKYAAVFFIALTVFASGYFLLVKPESHQITYIEKTVPNGKKAKIVLSDGTRVWINANSTLKYPLKMGKHFRKVFLTGEAYFDVVKNKKKPFIVITRDIKIKVLGTAFDVNAYPDNERIKTTLVRGKVNITGNNKKNQEQHVVLLPGQQAIYFKNANYIQVHKVNTAQYTAWIKGELIFNETTLENVVKQLRRRFNLNISIQDTEIRNYKYTGQFSHESPEEIMRILEKVTPTQFIKTDHGIIVKFDSKRKNMLYKRKEENNTRN